MNQVELEWHKVIKCYDFDTNPNLDFLKETYGIYLWILQGNGNGVPDRVVYVGETVKSFAERHVEHFRNQLSGIYTVFNVGDDEDFKDFLKKYWDNKTQKEMIADRKILFPTIWEYEEGCFRNTFFNPEKMRVVQKYLARLKFAFATIKSKNGFQFNNKEIEACLIEGLRDFYSDYTGQRLQMKNTGNKRYRTDIPIGSVSQYPRENFEILHSGSSLSSIPNEVTDITSYDKVR